MTLDPNDLRTYPVQEKPCKTCPFSGEKPLPLSVRLGNVLPKFDGQWATHLS